MYYIQNLNNLGVYQKSLELYRLIVTEVKIYNSYFYKIKKELINIVNNIALANGKGFYQKEKIKHYKEVIKISYSLESILKNDVDYHNKEKYISILKEIRSLSFTLKKREESIMKNTKNKYSTEKINYEDYTVKDLKKLKAYKIAIEYLEECIKIVDSLPDYEKFIMKDQLRRSSNSIVSNIAEGHGYADIYYKKAINSYNIALGSLKESQAQIEICYICKYITTETYDYANDIAKQITNLLITYIRNMAK